MELLGDKSALRGNRRKCLGDPEQFHWVSGTMLFLGSKSCRRALAVVVMTLFRHGYHSCTNGALMYLCEVPDVQSELVISQRRERCWPAENCQQTRRRRSCGQWATLLNAVTLDSSERASALRRTLYEPSEPIVQLIDSSATGHQLSHDLIGHARHIVALADESCSSSHRGS